MIFTQIWLFKHSRITKILKQLNIKKKKILLHMLYSSKSFIDTEQRKYLEYYYTLILFPRCSIYFDFASFRFTLYFPTKNAILSIHIILRQRFSLLLKVRFLCKKADTFWIQILSCRRYLFSIFVPHRLIANVHMQFILFFWGLLVAFQSDFYANHYHCAIVLSDFIMCICTEYRLCFWYNDYENIPLVSISCITHKIRNKTFCYVMKLK